MQMCSQTWNKDKQLLSQGSAVTCRETQGEEGHAGPK